MTKQNNNMDQYDQNNQLVHYLKLGGIRGNENDKTAYTNELRRAGIIFDCAYHTGKGFVVIGDRGGRLSVSSVEVKLVSQK